MDRHSTFSGPNFPRDHYFATTGVAMASRPDCQKRTLGPPQEPATLGCAERPCAAFASSLVFERRTTFTREGLAFLSSSATRRGHNRPRRLGRDGSDRRIAANERDDEDLAGLNDCRNDRIGLKQRGQRLRRGRPRSCTRSRRERRRTCSAWGWRLRGRRRRCDIDRRRRRGDRPRDGAVVTGKSKGHCLTPALPTKPPMSRVPPFVGELAVCRQSSAPRCGRSIPSGARTGKPAFAAPAAQRFDVRRGRPW